MSGFVLPILCGPFLWLAGAVVFDGVHWLLHCMLRSRHALLRALARPHAVHHEWIDRDLVTHWDRRSANVWCHIVPEYLTQLVFTGIVALVLPLAFAAVLAGLQTAVFLFILSFRGRDANHRPAARIDAHPPGWLTPPAYHVLHHAWPDAYFSAYTKLVDWIVGGGTQIAGRRFAWLGPESSLGSALRAEVERWGGCIESGPPAPDDVDVLVLTDPKAPLERPVEAFVAATRDRQLPPEVWALRADPEDAVARHYLHDPRVAFRALLVPGPECDEPSPLAARRAARRALFWIRRDAHVLAFSAKARASDVRRFRRVRPRVPEGAQRVRHRLELIAERGV